MKRLLLDFVVLGEVCNFRCGYCTSRKRPLALDGSLLEAVEANLDRALRPLADSFLIYRFGGGELFLAEAVVAGLLARRFPHTQFLTNGTRLSEGLLGRLREARDRVAVCLSLDGHTPEMNRMRQSAAGMTPSTLRRILENLSRLLDQGIPVEIQMVLSKANDTALRASLDFLLDHYPSENLLVSVFPVRPLPRDLDPTGLRSVLADYERYREILPSRDYVEGLLRSLSAKRTERCRVPEQIGFRILSRAWEPSAKGRRAFCECGGLRYFYGEICATCYTHYDLYNSILAGRTAPDEVPFPPFRNRSIRDYLVRHAAAADGGRGFSDLLAWSRGKLLGNRL
jgi:MoaA/NifB/PqqE/SkfB family radical SAM enzyme